LRNRADIAVTASPVSSAQLAGLLRRIADRTVSGKIAKSGRDAMQVRTPNSLLGVRGTRFIVEVPK